MAAGTRFVCSGAERRIVSRCHHLQRFISACEKREQWQQALGLPGSLDVFPNSVSYCAAISACDKGEQWQQALDLVVTEHVTTCNDSPGEQLSPHSWEERTREEKTRTEKTAARAAVSAGVGAARAA